MLPVATKTNFSQIEDFFLINLFLVSVKKKIYKYCIDLGQGNFKRRIPAGTRTI